MSLQAWKIHSSPFGLLQHWMCCVDNARTCMPGPKPAEVGRLNCFDGNSLEYMSLSTDTD